MKFVSFLFIRILVVSTIAAQSIVYQRKVVRTNCRKLYVRSAFQEYIESGLFKMMVRCEGIDKTHVIHDDKAGTISEAPFLIKPF